MHEGTPIKDPDRVRTPIGLGDLFSGFLLIGLFGFGGLAASANYVMVERRRWLTPAEFVDLFGICSVLPGGNFLNATIIMGDRDHGPLGSLACLTALLLMPLTIVVAVATAYDSFAYLPDVRAGLTGAASAAAGLILGTAGKMARSIVWTVPAAVFGAATFLCIGVLHLPLAMIILIVVPASVAWSAWSGRHRRRAGRGDGTAGGASGASRRSGGGA